jgi:hypothetical protein
LQFKIQEWSDLNQIQKNIDDIKAQIIQQQHKKEEKEKDIRDFQKKHP